MSRSDGPSGTNALLLVLLCSPFWGFRTGPNRFGEWETKLMCLELAGFALTALLAVALASVLRGPARGRWAAWVALAIGGLGLWDVIARLIWFGRG